MVVKPTVKDVADACINVNRDMVQNGAWEEAVPLTNVEFWRHQVNNIFEDLTVAEAKALAKKVSKLGTAN